KSIGDTQARMRMNLLPGQLGGADIQPAPTLRVCDEASHRHRSFDHGRQCIAHLDGFPEPRLRAANGLIVIMAIDVRQFALGVATDRLRFQVGVFRAFLARRVAVGAETPTVRLGDQVAVLIEEPHMVSLLHGAAGEAGLMLHQVLEPGFRGDLVIAHHRFMPGPIGACPHRVHAWQPPDITRNDPARREQETGQCDHAAPTRPRTIPGIAPQWVVVADTVRVVTNVVAGRLVAPRLQRVLDADADAPAQIVDALVGDLWELAHVLSRSILRLTLPAGVLGNSVTNSISLGYSCKLSRVFTRS